MTFFFFDEMTCDFNSVPQRILGILSYPKKKLKEKKNELLEVCKLFRSRQCDASIISALLALKHKLAVFYM